MGVYIQVLIFHYFLFFLRNQYPLLEAEKAVIETMIVGFYGYLNFAINVIELVKLYTLSILGGNHGINHTSSS